MFRRLHILRSNNTWFERLFRASCQISCVAISKTISLQVLSRYFDIVGLGSMQSSKFEIDSLVGES